MLKTNDLIEFGVMFIMSLLGALANDYYNTLTNKETTIDTKRILLGAFTGAIIMFGISDQLDKLNNKLFVLICFTSGIGGFNSFDWLRNLNFTGFISKYIKIENKEENKRQ